MFESFSQRARRTIFFANACALKEGVREITPEHILCALLKEDPVLFTVLVPDNPNFANELQRLLAAENKTQKTEKHFEGTPSLSSRSKEIVAGAWEHSKRLGHKSVGTQHLLLALLISPQKQTSWFHRPERQDDSRAKKIVVSNGLTAASAEAKMREGIITPQTWLLDEPMVKLNAQIAAIAELLISKGLFNRSDFVATLDRNEGPLTPELFVMPLIDALFERGILTASEKETVKSVGPLPASQKPHSAENSGPVTQDSSSTDRPANS